jgi:hypothetical protein
MLSNKIVDGRGYLRSVVVDGNLVLASLHLRIDSHGAEISVGRVGEEIESSQLVLCWYLLTHIEKSVSARIPM